MGKRKRRKNKQDTQRQTPQDTGQPRPFRAEELLAIPHSERPQLESYPRVHVKEPAMTVRDWLKGRSLTDWLLALFTFLLVLCTVGQIVIANSQLDSARKDQRPWMRIDLATQKIPDKGPATLPISVNIYNTGKTPAKSVDVKFFAETVKNGEEPQLSGGTPFSEMSTGIVYPNSILSNTLNYDFLESQLPDWNEGRVFLAIYSVVTYQDPFGTSHWGKTCSFAIGKPGNFSAKKCTDYNNADSN